MNLKRWLFLFWLAATLVWIVFAFLQFMEPRWDEITWTVWDVVDLLVVLFGLPLACLGAAVAIMFIPWDRGRQ